MIPSLYQLFGKKLAEGFWSPSPGAQKDYNFSGPGYAYTLKICVLICE